MLLDFERSIGIDHACIIGMSVYRKNNGCIVNALEKQHTFRGVAMLDPEATNPDEITALHESGFRGVRINLRTRSESMDATQWADTIMQYHCMLGRDHPEWVLQFFVSMDQIADIAPVLPRLDGRKVVFDHLGHPEPGLRVAEQRGCTELYATLTANRNVFVKLSGLYRLADVEGLDEHIRHLLQIAPDQIVWGSDWPHCAGPDHNPGGDPRALQDFLRVDMAAFIDQSFAWCKHDPVLVRKIWVDNPRRLWNYTSGD